MKTVSVVIPTFNEEANVPLIYERVRRIFAEALSDYYYEMLFIDNYSTDGTRKLLEALCREDPGVKAIFNVKNFGFTRSTYYGLSQATGDCAVLVFADMQDPPEMIPSFVREWENGYKIVVGIKNKSDENRLVYFMRGMYYKVIRNIAEVDHIEHFTGFGLYDRSFIDVIRELKDPMPYLRGIVAELGANRKEIFYTQAKREHGKSKFGFFKLYDLAMLGITSYTKVVMRIATILGFIVAFAGIITATATLIIKLINWNAFPFGTAAIAIGVFFFGGVQLFFIGFLGEYILNINTRVMNRPLVIEEKRINFENQKERTPL